MLRRGPDRRGGRGRGRAKEGEGEEGPAPGLSYMDAAVAGTLAALLEVALPVEECADMMVLAVHRLLADRRCDRARVLATL